MRPALITIDEFVGVEEKEGHVGESSGIGRNVGGLWIFLVVVENGEDFLIFERLAGEFLDERSRDLGGVFAGFGFLVRMVGLHFFDVGFELGRFGVTWFAIEDEVEGSLDLFGVGAGFLLEAEG